MRQRQFSDLVAQPKAGGGYRDPIEVAREKVDWILEHHQPEPLDEAKQAELKRILEAAERELS
jgi:trimethylamine:corrinoid methyltransferase-like protein